MAAELLGITFLIGAQPLSDRHPSLGPAPSAQGPVADLLVADGLSKTFSGLLVLDNASFSVAAGEVVMLVGENGAGKSTLKNIMCGLIRPDSGTITIGGESFPGLTTRDAERLGIGVIHQELSLFSNLTVAENIFIGRFPIRRGLVNWPALAEQTRALLHDEFGFDIDPRAVVDDLSLGQRQIVEIAKAMSHATSLMILDEPTTCLSVTERARLFEVVGRLKAVGYGIVYITHFMEEVYTLGDRVVVLRDGAIVGQGSTAEIDQRRLGTLMVGRSIEDTEAPPRIPADASVCLSVKGLTDRRTFQDIAFDLRSGEILGIGGLMGAGRSEVAEALIGLRPADGNVVLNGEHLRHRSPALCEQKGLVLVSEDRRLDQAFLSRPVRENLTATLLKKLRAALGLVMDPKREGRLAVALADRFSVSHPGLEAPMASLSGGNQQKVIVARWLGTEPSICILDEPTKGVDIGSRAAIHEMIKALVRAGKSVILISSDLPELLALSHRIIVLHKGRSVGDLDRQAATSEAIVQLASNGRLLAA